MNHLQVPSIHSAQPWLCLTIFQFPPLSYHLQEMRYSCRIDKYVPFPYESQIVLAFTDEMLNKKITKQINVKSLHCSSKSEREVDAQSRVIWGLYRQIARIPKASSHSHKNSVCCYLDHVSQSGMEGDVNLIQLYWTETSSIDAVIPAN